MNLGNLRWEQRLKILRTLKGWSQQEAANKCNTSQKVYWSWENGERYPRRNNQIAIAKAFEVSLEEIFGNQNNVKTM